MIECFYEVTKDGTTLDILLGRELSEGNAPALTEELSKYVGQGIQKIVYDAAGLSILTSSGIRSVIFAHKKLGSNPEIVFLNCAQEIREVLHYAGLTSYIKFEEDQKRRKAHRQKFLSDLDKDELDRVSRERKEALDNFESHNNIVCSSMKMGSDE